MPQQAASPLGSSKGIILTFIHIEKMTLFYRKDERTKFLCDICYFTLVEIAWCGMTGYILIKQQFSPILKVGYISKN